MTSKNELPKNEVEALERLMDGFSLEAILSALSYICGEKSAHVAQNWQDVQLAKNWMKCSLKIDAALTLIEDIAR